MLFSKARTAFCEMLLMSSAIGAVSAAAILKQRSLEIQMLTGTALSNALSAAKSNPKGNLTVPGISARRSSTTALRERSDPVCDNVLSCSILSGIHTIGDVRYGTESGVFADTLHSAIQSAATLNQDLPGDAAQSYYLAFEQNNYQYITSLLTNGVLELYLKIANTNIFLNSIVSLADINAVLPYCDDTTYDAVASRIASLVDGFLTQYAGSGNLEDASPTVITANVDADTGDVDGISVGASFVLASGSEGMSQVCPAFGDYW